MTCCVPSGDFALAMADPANVNSELLLASHPLDGGMRQNDLSVPAIHCGACIEKIERTLSGLSGVDQARVNLSTRRVTVRWHGETPPPLFAALKEIGYDAHLYDIGAVAKDTVLRDLVRALAVSGFAASNIMMLSIGIWSGADAATRDMFHWLSALIACPALFYAGRVFFRSAWRALARRQTNMDVPISIGVLLAFGMSLYETVEHGPHAYFDAAISLLFFLLIGRTLDHMMRERARTAVTGLARFSARGAFVLRPDGTRCYLPVNEIEPGMTILLAAGERVPVDARVVAGRSDIDCALVTGESLPQPVSDGSTLQAGTLNLTGPLTIVATAAAGESFLAEMTRMMEIAETGRSAYRRIADRAARLYAPVIHITALLTFAGWMIATGDAHRSITIAIAVLIITCPCALGLAVPMVQIVAARRLFDGGILAKDGSALERLAEADHVIFDKTGTLTAGKARLLDAGAIDHETLAIAAALGAHSRHPYSLALAAAGENEHVPPVSMTDVTEEPGAGLEGRIGETLYRLGRPDWALSDKTVTARSLPDRATDIAAQDQPMAVLSENGRLLGTFFFHDDMRAGSAEAVAVLQSKGFPVEILSGDREETVGRLASRLGVRYTAQVSPRGKVEHITALAASGRKVLMVGDGLNDAPALIAAHVSMAPATAADVGRNAADFVFLRDSLISVPLTVDIARQAGRLVRQNLALAVGYNMIAVPIAILGQVTPLLAAIAMSMSSILVVGNALRLGLLRRDRQSGRSITADRPISMARPATGSGG